MKKSIIIFLLVLISNGFALGKELSEDKTVGCDFNVKKAYIKQTTIKDSLICLVLDSALGMIKPIRKCYPNSFILSLDSTENLNIHKANLHISESFEWLDDEDFQLYTYLLSYKGLQIILYCSSSDPKYKFYFNFLESKSIANIYSPKILPINLANQEVLFEIDIVKRTCKLKSYKFEIIPLIKDDE